LDSGGSVERAQGAQILRGEAKGLVSAEVAFRRLLRL
jgi:hypothetical protein